MPTYEYACTACAERLEVVQRFTDPALTECPACGGTLRKVFSAVGVVFKGSGFYKTDSRSANGAAKGAAKPDAPASSSSDSASSSSSSADSSSSSSPSGGPAPSTAPASTGSASPAKGTAAAS